MTAIASLEAYSADHSETINELLEWPYRRFMKAYEAWQKRTTAERLDRKLDLHVAALHANETWDNEKNDKAKHIEHITSYYESVKDDVMTDPKLREAERRAEEETEMADPFVMAGKRNMAKVVPPKMNRNNQNG